jgi:hypothetical protein
MDFRTTIHPNQTDAAGFLTVKKACRGKGGFVRLYGSRCHFGIITLEMMPGKVEDCADVEIEWQSDDDSFKPIPIIANEVFDGVTEAVKLLCNVPFDGKSKVEYENTELLEQGVLSSCSITIIDQEHDLKDSDARCFRLATYVAIVDCLGKEGFNRNGRTLVLPDANKYGMRRY